MGLTHLGQIIKHKGLDGNVVFKLNFGINFNYQKTKSLFINLNNSKVPIQIEKIKKIDSYHYLLKFCDLNRREETQKTINKDVFIEQISNKSNLTELSKIIDYKIYEDGKMIGFIKNFYEKNQPIIFCEINKKEALIPFVNEIIKSIDHLNHKIHVKIPKGLLDLNQ
jgi:16S rRNA processing protein RimM